MKDHLTPEERREHEQNMECVHEFLLGTADTPAPTAECANTDRELWREREGDYYANSVFVTERGGIGFNVAGHCIVKPLADWHILAAQPAPAADDGDDNYIPTVPPWPAAPPAPVGDVGELAQRAIDYANWKDAKRGEAGEGTDLLRKLAAALTALSAERDAAKAAYDKLLTTWAESRARHLTAEDRAEQAERLFSSTSEKLTASGLNREAAEEQIQIWMRAANKHSTQALVATERAEAAEQHAEQQTEYIRAADNRVLDAGIREKLTAARAARMAEALEEDKSVEAACREFYRRGHGWDSIPEGSINDSSVTRHVLRAWMREALRAALRESGTQVETPAPEKPERA